MVQYVRYDAVGDENVVRARQAACRYSWRMPESVVSSDVEQVESVRFADRLGERAQRCGGVECAVGPVLVVERLVLAERVEKTGLVDDQGLVEEFGSAGSAPTVP